MSQVAGENYGAVDIVCNAFTPDAVENGWMSVDPEFRKKVRVKPEYRDGVTLDEYMAMMDRCGIERSFLIASRSGDLRIQGSAHMPTDYIADLVENHPNRFSGLIGVDPSKIMDSLAEVEHAVNELGFVGAHLYPHWLQVGHCLVYNPQRRLPSVGRPICLDRIAMDFPTLKLIGIHIGYPWYEEMISVAWKHPNVYIGLDAYAPKHWPEATKHYMNSFGQDKVMFGTDWPVVDPERAMEDVKNIDWSPNAKRKVLRDNALNLYSL